MQALEANEANQTAIASISKLKANQFEMKRKAQKVLLFYNFHTHFLSWTLEKLKRVERLKDGHIEQLRILKAIASY